jgi:hypothetical protein
MGCTERQISRSIRLAQNECSFQPSLGDAPPILATVLWPRCDISQKPRLLDYPRNSVTLESGVTYPRFSRRTVHDFSIVFEFPSWSWFTPAIASTNFWQVRTRGDPLAARPQKSLCLNIYQLCHKSKEAQKESMNNPHYPVAADVACCRASREHLRQRSSSRASLL